MLSAKQIKENQNRILKQLSKIERSDIEQLVNWLMGSDYFTAPASTMYHGHFEGGLAAHSYKVYEEFKDKVRHYQLSVPEESAFLAGICHDFCKINLYVPNRLKDGKLSGSKPYKVDDDFPMGHGEKSVILVQRHISLTEQEAIIIRWHMGSFDPAWEEYKEKTIKKYPETLLFQHADQEVSLYYRL